MIQTLTNPAAFVAANAATFAAPAKLKIGEFRRLVDGLGWSRNWLTGGTAEEFARQDVPGVLLPKVAELEAAMGALPARFAADLESARAAVEYARRTIARWQVRQ